MTSIMTITATAILLFTQHTFAMISSETDQLAKNMGAAQVSEVNFGTSNTSLTDDQKKEINEAVAEARKLGEVEDIKILAWSDKEYPLPKTKHTKADVTLADNRIKEVKKYIKDGLHISSVDSYNMAERPSKLSELFKTSNAKIKKDAVATGAAPSDDDTGFLGLNGHKSKAVIMVFLKK